MRETCTSGSVRAPGSNPRGYSTKPRAARRVRCASQRFCADALRRRRTTALRNCARPRGPPPLAPQPPWRSPRSQSRARARADQTKEQRRASTSRRAGDVRQGDGGSGRHPPARAQFRSASAPTSASRAGSVPVRSTAHALSQREACLSTRRGVTPDPTAPGPAAFPARSDVRATRTRRGVTPDPTAPGSAAIPPGSDVLRAVPSSA
jgi:hypothetical protein